QERSYDPAPLKRRDGGTSPMRTAFLTLTAAAALVLAGCDSAATNAQEDGPTTTPTEEELVNTLSSSVLLNPEGLQVQAEPAGEIVTVAMDSPRDAAVQAVSAALGQPDETGDMTECGAGPMSYATWDNGFQLLFQQDRVAGWQSTSEDLNTPSDL